MLNPQRDCCIPPMKTDNSISRRTFLRNTSVLMAAAAATPAVVRPGYTAEANEIKVALVGCGGRGTGAAAQALATAGPVKLVAMADVFENRLDSSLANVVSSQGAKVDVPKERAFVGLDGYKKAMDALPPGGVVLLCTPPAFRPEHFAYAVSKGLHVFMEKSFAVDGPGIRRVLETGKEAEKKNLKVAGGLVNRHYVPFEEAIAKIHGGLIGDLQTIYAYRMHGPVKISPRQQKESELSYQIRNYSCFTWLNGSFIVDWLIHNIDVSCWLKNDWPVSVQGIGGRQVREDADQLFDHYTAEYTFADGSRMIAQGRHINKTYDFFGVTAHGTKGSGLLGEGQLKPRLFKSLVQNSENMIWSYSGPPCSHYQREHDLLFEAIRKDLPYNETDRCAKANLVAIMGRMACESGQQINFTDALNSNLEIAPTLKDLKWDSTPPVAPDANGKYPVAMPGQTVVI
jgi:predicted dehydrogenase